MTATVAAVVRWRVRWRAAGAAEVAEAATATTATVTTSTTATTTTATTSRATTTRTTTRRATGSTGQEGHKKHHGKRRLHRCCGPFTIVSNPFPATVRPGSSLPVMVRFTATCAGPACCELVIRTDDPDHKKTKVFVTGSLHRTLRSAAKCWAADELQELLRAGSRPC